MYEHSECRYGRLHCERHNVRPHLSAPMADCTVSAAMAGLTMSCRSLTAGHTFSCGRRMAGPTEKVRPAVRRPQDIVRPAIAALTVWSAIGAHKCGLSLWRRDGWPHLLLWAPDGWPHVVIPLPTQFIVLSLGAQWLAPASPVGA